MKWYIAKLVFRIICSQKNHTPQFEDQWLLLQATDQMEAFLKARKRGESEETQDALVSWKFIDVGALLEIAAPHDGLQLFTRIYEIEEGSNFSALVTDKAKILYEKALETSIGIS